ncbi:5-oxoprolinase subunit PxpB [Halomonas sp. AOP42-B2-16]|uniref:5-oxoprolinase subunit PxpB n=1 Tax=Halomonas sp. AOP42-B2-16 TaxID=3457673 RepID=UPI0040346316
MNKIPDKPLFSELGESALLCEYATGALNLERQQRIWAVASGLGQVSGVQEIIPGMNNLAVVYDPGTFSPVSLAARIEELWFAPAPDTVGGRIHEIAVTYGGEAGPDLVVLAEAAGMTPVDFAELHAGGDYTVYALGSQPGFGYLGGLVPRLAAPRRTVVHPRVEAGRVIIGGAQTAVQACTTPSGWHMIGRTETIFFDPSADSPALLAPGDRIKFKLLEVLA